MELYLSVRKFYLQCDISIMYFDTSFRTFVKFAQKNCQTMKRKSRTFMKNIFTQMRRSVTVLLEVVGLWRFVIHTRMLLIDETISKRSFFMLEVTLMCVIMMKLGSASG